MTRDDVLDKNLPIPIHHQLYCHIKKCIEEGEYHPNQIIPSEDEMQRMFSVSQITVRRAIADLQHDGYLRKYRGKGTVVLPMREKSNATRLVGFSEDAIKRGERPMSVVLKCVSAPANVKVAESLRVEIDESVFFLKRLRLINGVLVGLHNTYISGRIGLDIKRDDFSETTSLYGYFKEHGVHLDAADELLSAIVPTSEIKKELYLDDNQPVVYRERVSYDASGTPLEYSENYYISDRYKYYIRLKRIDD